MNKEEIQELVYEWESRLRVEVDNILFAKSKAGDWVQEPIRNLGKIRSEMIKFAINQNNMNQEEILKRITTVFGIKGHDQSINLNLEGLAEVLAEISGEKKKVMCGCEGVIAPVGVTGAHVCGGCGRKI